MDLFEIVQSFIFGIFEFFTGIYKLFLESTVTTFLNFFDLSYDEFATYGVNTVDSLFSKFDFTSEKFTDNFIYFFIGILFFAMFIKIMFKLLSFLITFAVEAVKGFIPFL